MMERHATAVWNGDLHHGGGSISVESGRLDEAQYSAKSRFEDEKGTNPEELLAAAHAGCFAMQLSHLLALNGTPAEELHAKSTITMGKDGAGFAVQSSALVLTGRHTQTLPVAIPSLITPIGTSWGQVAAVGTVTILPVLIIAFIVQKHIVAGMTGGAVSAE